MTSTDPDPCPGPEALLPLPLAPDPEALLRSDNPWDWLLASFLGLGETEPRQPSAVRPVAG